VLLDQHLISEACSGDPRHDMGSALGCCC